MQKEQLTELESHLQKAASALRSAWILCKHNGMEPVAKEIERRVYHNTSEHKSYLSARFDMSGSNSRVSFEWGGHRWAYRYTHFDDCGEYDLIVRPLPAPQSAATEQEPSDDEIISLLRYLGWTDLDHEEVIELAHAPYSTGKGANLCKKEQK